MQMKMTFLLSQNVVTQTLQTSFIQLY